MKEHSHSSQYGFHISYVNCGPANTGIICPIRTPAQPIRALYVLFELRPANMGFICRMSDLYPQECSVVSYVPLLPVTDPTALICPPHQYDQAGLNYAVKQCSIEKIVLSSLSKQKITHSFLSQEKITLSSISQEMI